VCVSDDGGKNYNDTDFVFSDFVENEYISDDDTSVGVRHNLATACRFSCLFATRIGTALTFPSSVPGCIRI